MHKVHSRNAEQEKPGEKSLGRRYDGLATVGRLGGSKSPQTRRNVTIQGAFATRYLLPDMEGDKTLGRWHQVERLSWLSLAPAARAESAREIKTRLDSLCLEVLHAVLTANKDRILDSVNVQMSLER